MSVRLLLTDEIWEAVKKKLNEIKSKVGRPPDIDDRCFIEAVLYVARTGIPWRDLPACFGHFSALYNRLRRWERNGTWQELWEPLETDDISLGENLFIDTTCIRAHQHAAGAAKKKGARLSGEAEVDFRRKSTSVA
ncbi:IS5 family transposase [Candidatus Poribacteria bacterium]|nr:IS5 family transposase [Candidatus Poribacteria bacterium]